MSGMPSPARVVVVDPAVVGDVAGAVVDDAPAVVDVDGVVSGTEVSAAPVSGTVVVSVPVPGVVVDDDGAVVTVVELDGSVVDVESAAALPAPASPAVRVSAAVATTKKVARR
jgi:hypothetical protein